MPDTPRDRILIVDNDPLSADLIGRQALQAAGYETRVVEDLGSALMAVTEFKPDLVITSLHLPGLSGKDLMVALASQGNETPVIFLARRGGEADVIQAFRLGAVDFMLHPLREAEIVATVERALRQVYARRERLQLAQKLQQANLEMQQRVKELTTIYAAGKAVTTITDQSQLFERILENVLNACQADLGWFLLRDEKNRAFIMAAQRSLPPSLATYLHHAWDDGVSSLVAMSGESLSINGEPFKRFKVSMLGESALITPVKAQKQVISLLVMLRKKNIPFSASDQRLAEALADYVSVALVNARLFQTLEERARSAEKSQAQAISAFGARLQPTLQTIAGRVYELSNSSLKKEQRELLVEIQEQLLMLKKQAG